MVVSKKAKDALKACGTSNENFFVADQRLDLVSGGTNSRLTTFYQTFKEILSLTVEYYPVMEGRLCRDADEIKSDLSKLRNNINKSIRN